MVTKTTFNTFSLSHPDGNYFLRPDRIMGAFFVDRSSPPDSNANSEAELNSEIADDEESSEHIMNCFWKSQCNVVKVTAAIKSYWSNDILTGNRDSTTVTSPPVAVILTGNGDSTPVTFPITTSLKLTAAPRLDHHKKQGGQLMKNQELLRTAQMPGDIEIAMYPIKNDSSVVGVSI
jgi:hypothetical protein